MRQQFPLTISKVLEADKRVQVLLGDIGVFGFRHIFENYPQNILNIGILEQATVGVAAGFALGGDIPVVHTIAPFLVERAFEQLKVDFGYQNLGGNFVSVGGAYDYSRLGCTHHCPADLALLANIPGFQLVVPGTDLEFDALFQESYANGSATYYRLSEESNLLTRSVKFGRHELLKLGSKKHLVFAVGPTLDRVVGALADTDVTIFYCTTLAPFDTQHIFNLKPEKITIIASAYESVGYDLVGPVSKTIGATLHVIGIPRSFIQRYGSRQELDTHVGLDEVSIRMRFQCNN